MVFWDLFGEQGHPIRTTVSEMGPLLLARLLGLNETQEGVLNIAFRDADDEGLLLLDLKDLQAMLAYIAEHAGELTTAVRQRRARRPSARSSGELLTLDSRAASTFFGEPALDDRRPHPTDEQGRGPGQRARRRQADALAQALRDVPALAARRAVRGAARGRAIPRSRSSSSSSTRRTCCSTTRPRRC